MRLNSMVMFGVWTLERTWTIAAEKQPVLSCATVRSAVRPARPARVFLAIFSAPSRNSAIRAVGVSVTFTAVECRDNDWA